MVKFEERCNWSTRCGWKSSHPSLIIFLLEKGDRLSSPLACRRSIGVVRSGEPDMMLGADVIERRYRRGRIGHSLKILTGIVESQVNSSFSCADGGKFTLGLANYLGIRP